MFSIAGEPSKQEWGCVFHAKKRRTNEDLKIEDKEEKSTVVESVRSFSEKHQGM